MINMCAQLTVHILVNRIINIWLANSVNQYIYILATYNLPIWIVNIQCSFIPWCVIFPSSHKAMWIRNPWLRKMLMCQLVSAQNVVKYPGFEKYNIYNHIYSLIYIPYLVISILINEFLVLCFHIEDTTLCIIIDWNHICSISECC